LFTDPDQTELPAVDATPVKQTPKSKKTPKQKKTLDEVIEELKEAKL
jgi:hypothetical protein